MSEGARNLVYGLVIAAMATALAALLLTSPGQADRVDQIGSSIKCPVCQGEAIANSPSAMARDMMALVEERVAQGWTDQQIIDELLASYSGAVLLDPPASGPTLVLWLAPAAALLVGAVVIWWWRRHPGTADAMPTGPAPRSRARMLIGGLVLAAAFAGAVVAVGFFVQERQGPVSGVAGPTGQDLAEVSNDTMEAVISANPDHPEVDGMRLALAERYFEAGDYRSAFPHYLAVAGSSLATSGQTVTALIRLGWMAWDGNQAVGPALDMFDQALEIDPTSSTARYLKGRVLWCGAGDLDEAARLFADVLRSGRLDEGSLDLVASELEAVERGEACA